MRILTPENTPFLMSKISEEMDDMQYCVLDYSNKENVDYIFVPLVFLECFSMPVADLQIGPYRVEMPLGWSVVVGEKDMGDIEIMELKKINDREFHTFVMNPISGFMPQFYTLEITSIYPDRKWYFPKLKNGHILGVPLSDGPNPPVAYFLQDINKCPEILDIGKLV